MRITAVCSKCQKELEVEAGTIDKKHKHCGGRKSDGSSKIDCGKWEQKKIVPVK